MSVPRIAELMYRLAGGEPECLVVGFSWGSDFAQRAGQIDMAQFLCPEIVVWHKGIAAKGLKPLGGRD